MGSFGLIGLLNYFFSNHFLPKQNIRDLSENEFHCVVFLSMLLSVISNPHATALIVHMGGATTMHLTCLHFENHASDVNLSI